MECLLCKSSNLKITERYSKKDLIPLWKGIYPDIVDELTLNTIYFYKCTDCNLNFFDPKLAGGDKFYSELGKLDWYYLHSGKTEYDYVQKYIKEKNKILDIGAGRGVLFTKINKQVDYTGLELSTKAVKLAQNAGINVIKEDLILHSQSHKNSYDIVCLFQVLEHLTELDEFLKSIYLTLKNRGLFVIAVPDNDGFISYTSNYTFNLPPHHTILWTESSLKYLAKKYNFNILEIYKESLQDVHKDVAYTSYLLSKLKKIFLVKNLLIDNRIIFKLLNLSLNIVLRSNYLKSKIYQIVSKKLKLGQTVIILLQKNE